MTCNGCVAAVKSQLLKISDITEAEIQLAYPQGRLRMQKHIPVQELQMALSKAGDYKIKEADTGMENYKVNDLKPATWFATYKPIVIIAVYITGITLLAEMRSGFNIESWMTNFMAGFFLLFCFFKVLDLKGFAESYATYDIIAKRWQGWGYVYSFIELGLGISYLLRWNLVIANWVTLVVMSISIIGVLQTVLNKKKIRCACLGAVFNLPMSTVTIIEDALMIGMSAAMLVMMA